MTKLVQLELFEEVKPSFDDLMRQIESTQSQMNRVRKGLFRRYDEVLAEVDEMRLEIRKALRELKNTKIEDLHDTPDHDAVRETSADLSA